MAWIDRLFEMMVQSGASDLHLTSSMPPMFRLHGDIVPVEGFEAITPECMEQILEEIAPEANWQEYQRTHDTDFAYALEGLARFRSNLFADHRGPGAVFRVIPSEILSAEKLGLPKAVLDLCQLSKGLVLVTGPTGSGKSTTLAAMIDHINSSRAEHVITIEDPIEFVHPSKKCLVNQREVRYHTDSFKRALRAALREDPDIVLVGEMRDLETIEMAIETAETGHLVFGTLHTSTAATTVDRIIDQFPSERQAQIRTMLASSLKGVVAQTLCRKVGGGRVAALETLIVNNAVAANIREGKTHQIPSLMQMGGRLGSRLLNDALLELVQKGLVDPNEAYLKCIAKEDFAKKCEAEGFRLAALGIEVEEGTAAPAAGAYGSAPGAAPQRRPGMAVPGAPTPEGGAARPAGQGAPSPYPRAPLPKSAAPQATPKPTPSSGTGNGGFFDKFKRS